jgi:hypothetical protein
VARPDYVVLPFPFRTGEPLPVTSWNAIRSTLAIDVGDGEDHAITFDRTAVDKRTRLSWSRLTQGRRDGTPSASPPSAERMPL